MNEIITISSTNGTETFQNSGIFAGIQGNIFFLGLARKKQTDQVMATFEDVENSTLQRKEKSWQESQVVALCRDHPDQLSVDLGNFFQIQHSMAFVFYKD